NYRGFRQIIIPGLSAHAIIFILITPSLLTIISLQHYFFNFSIPFAFSEFPSWVEKITWRNILFTVKNFSIGYNIDLHSLPGAISTIVYSVLFACGLRRYPYGKKGRLLFLFLFLPVAIILLASQVKPFYVDRYFFYLLPFFLIGVAIGLSKTKKYILNGALFVVLILNFSALKNYHYNLLPSDYNQHIGIVEKLKGVTELSHFISDKFKEGDRIIHTCKKTVFPLKFYVKHYHNSFPLFAEVEKGTLAYIPGEGENLRYIDYKGTHPRLIDIENMYKPKVHPRVWLILSAFSSRKAVKENLPEYLIVELFKNNYCIEKCKEFGDVRLYLLKSCENTFNIPAAL
ncbi:MAG: hypothetical protein KKH11_03200, partial [Candidatus Omnitrophica bacterium]|nr:hypothetical protein [Candidatus Omnitrophota bacterium]